LTGKVLAKFDVPPLKRPCFLCHDGPENGPFTAAVCRTARRILNQNGSDIEGLYAISGSVPSALKVAAGEDDDVCDIWLNLKPEDIVGNASIWKSGIQTIWNFLTGRESIISGNELEALLRKHVNMDTLFSDNAKKVVIIASDFISSKPVYATNKIPEHRDCIIEVSMGSMALVPWFPASRIKDPVALKLSTEPCPYGMYLIDGAYSNSFPLEEIASDELNFDSIFIVDINGLNHSNVDLNDKNVLSMINKFRRSSRITLKARDEYMLKSAHKVNEQIRLKQQLRKLSESLPPVYAKCLNDIMCRMENGVLQLHRKKEIPIYIISNKKLAMPFNFATFKPGEIKRIMKAGHNAALTVMRKLGLDTRGFKLNQFPTKMI
jgi:predicted acylesterase/phospholipase RssA